MAEMNMTQLRDALAWVTNDQSARNEDGANPFVWFWEAIQGDFNEQRSTAQILTDAGISMIPLVDQVCDVRDLIANCRKLSRDVKDTWAWVALALTLIGLFPSLGSLVKGVLKIFFAYIRRAGRIALAPAVEDAMTLVLAYLRRRDVQRYLKNHHIDQVFRWLADQIKTVRAAISKGALLRAFDRGISALELLSNKVAYVPRAGMLARNALEEVRKVRMAADSHLAAAIRPVQDVVDVIIKRLEREAIEARHGIVDIGNVHYKGALPEGPAIKLMRKRQPEWLSRTGDKFIDPADPNAYSSIVKDLSAKVDPAGVPRSPDEIYPFINERSIRSFHSLEPHAIRGPARLYRILAPNSRAMSDCWVTEAVFERLQTSSNPKHAWRRFLAVWPDWNVNGQFVIYDVRAGETLNTWRGPASSQVKADLPGFHLEGGWEQIVFNIERKDRRNDLMTYYPIKGKSGRLGPPLSQNQVDAIKAKMTEKQKVIFDESHLALRHNINHPNISGPFDTGWGYNEFDGAGLYDRIGLPSLPGQTTTIHP
ncbi:hypothetical protein [Massilia sp. DD77]|uniref:hypothetical protein n=1 Tax=Massilia sp. DD77 TaxID=3109349 RepID=UPI002FFFA951